MFTLQNTINIYRGTKISIAIPVFDVDNDPLDLTNYDLVYKISPEVNKDAIITKLSSDGSITKTDNIATLTITSEETKLLDADFYHYHELFLIDPSGENEILMAGTIIVKESLAAQHGA